MLRRKDFQLMIKYEHKYSMSLSWKLSATSLNFDVNAKFNRFLSILDELVKRHAPWINGKIQKMMRIRDRILRKLKKNSNQSLIDLYKQLRNRVSVSLNESKASYFYNYV